MPGWMERRDRAATLSIAGALAVLLLSIVMGGYPARLVAGLMIVVASIGMAAYYVIDREAPDRVYSVGLFLFTAILGALIAGLSARMAAAMALGVVVLALIASALGKRRG